MLSYFWYVELRDEEKGWNITRVRNIQAVPFSSLREEREGVSTTFFLRPYRDLLILDVSIDNLSPVKRPSLALGRNCIVIRQQPEDRRKKRRKETTAKNTR